MAKGDVVVSGATLRAFDGNIFDGVDDYVEIPHNVAQLGANLTNGFTFSAWINPRSTGESGAKVLDKSAGTAAQNGFHWGYEPVNNAMQIRVNNSTNRLGANNSITNGIWQHVLVTVNSTPVCNHYINSILTGSANQAVSQALSTITTTNVLRIGNRSQATDRTFDGSIRDVKMWNRVLSASEIANDYAGVTPKSGLLYHYKLGGDYSNYGTLPDGSSATATNSGSVSQIVEDTGANIIKNIYSNAGKGLSGAIMLLAKGSGGQILTTAIQNLD